MAFFRGLTARGLSGVQLVTSDAHRGLVDAIGATLPGACWQRCRTHYLRDLLTQGPPVSSLCRTTTPKGRRAAATDRPIVWYRIGLRSRAPVVVRFRGGALGASIRDDSRFAYACSVTVHEQDRRAVTEAERSVLAALMTYVDTTTARWTEVEPGYRRMTLVNDHEWGTRIVLLQYDAGYQLSYLNEHDEYLYVVSGTFVDQNQASTSGTFIHNRPGSSHQPSSPDGCTFLAVVRRR